MVAELRNVAVSLSGRAVLGPVSMSLSAGQVVGLLGPNGAGKSTLMRALAGLIPSGGDISIEGQNLSSMSAGARSQKLAFLPQARSVGWGISVADLVALGRLPWRAYGAALSPADSAICDDAMWLMDVTALASRPADQLSGGEQARVLAARAIAQDTPLLVADEPASGLDPAHQIAMMQAFRQLAAKGRTVLVSLHDLTLAARWCDRVVVLSKGRISADGAVADVLTESLLRGVYGIEAMVADVRGGLVLAPLSLASAPSSGEGAP